MDGGFIRIGSILNHIFSYCDKRSLASNRLISRLFHQIITLNYLRKKIPLQPKNLSPSLFAGTEILRKENSSSIIRLIYLQQAFVIKNYIVGVYVVPVIYDGHRIAPHLLTLDMNTEKLIWGISLLNDSHYHLTTIKDNIVLQVEEHPINFIKVATGKIFHTLPLPHIMSKEDTFHINPEDFGYIYIDREKKLIGGQIIEGKWNTVFEAAAPSYSFLPLSTHVGFHNEFKKSLLLFGPTGTQITLNNCLSVKAKGNKLYSLEKDPSNKGRCLLNIRTLKDTEEVISEVEESVPIDAKVSLISIADNGHCILYSRKNKSSIIFASPYKRIVHKSEYKVSYRTQEVIDSTSGEIWSWNGLSGEILKISPESETYVKKSPFLQSSGLRQFFHVVQNRYYFMEKITN